MCLWVYIYIGVHNISNISAYNNNIPSSANSYSTQLFLCVVTLVYAMHT